MNSNVNLKLNSLSFLIGNTPLLAIRFKYKDEIRVIYAKAENHNMTGSIKDRMALHIIKKAYERGVLKPGYRILEATSGNTGISFSAIGRAIGHKVIIFMPDWLSRERIDLIKSLGADINLISKEDGGFLGSISRSENYAKENPDTFLPRQFSNTDNVSAHYETTGPEIWWQLKFNNLEPDAFIAGVGTGGTVMGAGRYLKEMNPAIRIHPLEPSNSPTLSTGHKVGKHRIQGISDEFIPEIVNLNSLDKVISIDDGDAIIMAQKLAAELGIAVGISSGGNFLGALKVQNELGTDATVVTVFSDDNKKYLSTDLMKNEPVKSNFLSNDIELISFSAFKRTCQLYCDPLNCKEAVYNGQNDLPFSRCPRQ